MQFDLQNILLITLVKKILIITAVSYCFQHPTEIQQNQHLPFERI